MLVLGLSILLGVDLILSLAITIAALIIAHRPAPRELWVVAKRVPLGTVPIIIGTMVFRRMLEASNAIEATSGALAGLGIALPIVIFTVPLLAGLLTGLAVAAFAIGFPIVIPLCGPDVLASGCGLLAFAGGYVGLLLSPVHLCLVLTKEYFKADFGRVYRRLVPLVALLTLAALGVLFLWEAIGLR